MGRDFLLVGTTWTRAMQTGDRAMTGSNTFEGLASYYGELYPGFPPVVHAIMAHTAMGKTPKEAVDLCGDYTEQIRSEIDYQNKTKMARGSDGQLIMPEVMPEISEVAELDPEEWPALCGA